MKIYELRVEQDFYIPLHNFLIKYFWPETKIVESKKGIMIKEPRKYMIISGYDDARQESLYFHLFGVYYIKVQWYYNYDR